MKAEGIDVVSFAAGEPDFPTPKPICDEAIAALNAGFTKYTPSSGIVPLKEAIVEKLARENGLTYKPGQIVVSCGAKQSLYNTIQVLVNPGDEVLIFAPYWMTYADQIRLAGGIPVVVPTSADSGFVPTPEAIQAKLSTRTRAAIINSPSNPTGAVYPKATLQVLADLAVQHDFWVVADERFTSDWCMASLPSVSLP
jgi:aspartate aminotransferase